VRALAADPVGADVGEIVGAVVAGVGALFATALDSERNLDGIDGAAV
jgi:hypothetical protein